MEEKSRRELAKKLLGEHHFHPSREELACRLKSLLEQQAESVRVCPECHEIVYSVKDRRNRNREDGLAREYYAQGDAHDHCCPEGDEHLRRLMDECKRRQQESPKVTGE